MRRALGSAPTYAAAVGNWLGHIAVAQGDYAAARAHYAASLAARQEVGFFTVGLALTLSGFANLAAAQGRCARAARLAACRRAIGDDAFAAAGAEGEAMTTEQAVAYALAEEAAGHA